MKSFTTEGYRHLLAGLPKSIQSRARSAYRQFRANPNHQSLHFKKVHPTQLVYSARVTKDYRVLGKLRGDEIVWFWSGKHEEYERMLKAL